MQRSQADILILKDSKGRDWFLVRSGTHSSPSEAKKAALAIKEKLGMESAIRPAGDW